MSHPEGGPPEEGAGKVTQERTGGDYAPSVATKVAVWQKAGGIAVPVLTTILAFFIGGLVVLVTTGKNPLSTYKAIFDGTGLNWFFPWVQGVERTLAAEDLQQTLIVTTTLILVGLAVAFAFRCGLFNIGGQGQYIAGMVAAASVGIYLPDVPHVPHMILAAAGGALAGAVW